MEEERAWVWKVPVGTACRGVEVNQCLALVGLAGILAEGDHSGGGSVEEGALHEDFEAWFGKDVGVEGGGD